VKHLLLSSALVFSLFTVTGCAASSASEDDGGEDAALADSPENNKDSGKNEGGGQQCVQSCTSDLDCQNSCPTVPQGENCCDTSTGICYAYSSTTCPVPVSGDAGLD